MSFKNKSNKIQENEVKISSVSYTTIIGYAQQLAGYIEDLNDAIEKLEQAQQAKAQDDREPVPDLTIDENTGQGNPLVQKLKQASEKLESNYQVLLYVSQWFKSASKHVKKIENFLRTKSAGPGIVSKTMATLGNIINTLTEQSEKPVEVSFDDVKAAFSGTRGYAQNPNDRDAIGKAFLLSIADYTKPVPKEAFQEILQSADSSFGNMVDTKIYKELITRPLNLANVLRKTMKLVSDLRVKAFKSIGRKKRTDKAIRGAAPVEELDISAEEAKVLEILNANAEDIQNESTEQTERIFKKDYIEKLKNAGKLSDKQYELAISMADNKAKHEKYAKYFVISRIKDPAERAKALNKTGEEEGGTQAYRKTDIQLPKDNVAATKEYKMLDRFFNYVSKLKLSENFSLQDLQPVGNITTKEILEKILGFYDELNPSEQQLFKTILARGNNKRAMVEKLVRDTQKNSSVHSLQHKAFLYRRELDKLTKTGEEVLVGIGDDIFSVEQAADPENTARGKATPEYRFDLYLKPEGGGKVIKKEFNAEDFLKLKDEITTGRSKEEMDAVREIERLKREKEEEARKAKEQAEKEELERQAREIEQKKKEAEEAKRRQDDEAIEQALKDAQEIADEEPSELEQAKKKVGSIRDDLASSDAEPWYYEGEEVRAIIFDSETEEFGIQVTEEYDEETSIKLTAKGLLRALDTDELSQMVPLNDEEQEAIEDSVKEFQDEVEQESPNASANEKEKQVKDKVEQAINDPENKDKFPKTSEMSDEDRDEVIDNVIELPSKSSASSQEKKYIEAARKIERKFAELKSPGDDRIANDIEGFLDVYDNEQDKDGAFDLIDPIEEGKAGSILKSIEATIRKKNLPIKDNIFDNVKIRYNKLKAKLKELSKDAKNNKEIFVNHARTFLKYYKIINNFPKFVEDTLKDKPQKPSKKDQRKVAENIESLIKPLVRNVVRKEWQKRIT